MIGLSSCKFNDFLHISDELLGIVCRLVIYLPCPPIFPAFDGVDDSLTICMEFLMFVSEFFPDWQDAGDIRGDSVVKMAKSAFSRVQLQWCDILAVNDFSKIPEPCLV